MQEFHGRRRWRWCFWAHCQDGLARSGGKHEPGLLRRCPEERRKVLKPVLPEDEDTYVLGLDQAGDVEHACQDRGGSESVGHS